MINLIASIQADKNMRRNQKNITLTEKQIEIIEIYYGKIKQSEIGRKLGITKAKLMQNLRLLGYPPTRSSTVTVKEISKYFDMTEMERYYRV